MWRMREREKKDAFMILVGEEGRETSNVHL